VTQSGAWNMSISGTVPVSGPLTDTQLRASAVPVTVSADIQQKPSKLGVTAIGAAAAAVTLTLPAVAGLFHNISLIEIELYSTAARTGVAAPITVTTTNLPGSPAFLFSTAAAIGTIDRVVLAPAVAMQSTAPNVATTIVCPAVTGGIWRVNVQYYTGT
jgi:hypothetical protein